MLACLLAFICCVLSFAHFESSRTVDSKPLGPCVCVCVSFLPMSHFIIIIILKSSLLALCAMERERERERERESIQSNNINEFATLMLKV